MTVSISKSAFVVSGGQTVALSQAVSVTPDAGNPAYLVLTGMDRDDYTADATGETGTLSGNGSTDQFTLQSGDVRGIGIVFTYDAATGQYVNSTYGSLAQLEYTASASDEDVVNFGLFGLSNASLAEQYAADPLAMMQLGASGYLGSASILTDPAFSGTVPSQATPDSIAATANSFAGQAWNIDGCWTLTSAISTEAGAALPMDSTLVGAAAQGGGEWIVAYDGPVTANADWESLVQTGEMISFAPGGTGGHITTVVSGSGASAMVVDNVQYLDNGVTVNAADDGSADDLTIAAAHPFVQELDGVPDSSVVIYELDTPTVTLRVSTDTLAAGATQTLDSLFAATEPGTRAITEYQAYDATSGESFTVGGVSSEADSAATAVTAASLSAITYAAGTAAGSDTIEVRAFNGAYWGDWTALGVTVSPPAPPAVAHQTADQTWTAGQSVALNLSDSFSSVSPLAMTVTQADGTALPTGLTFNAATDMLSGTAPINAQTLGLMVTATDLSGQSASEVFQAAVAMPAPPVLANRTPHQHWMPGQTVSFTLPPGTFSDTAHQQLVYAAHEVSGADATSWLHFNASTDTLSGIVPTTVAGTGMIGLTITATDSFGQSASDSFWLRLDSGSGTTPLHWQPLNESLALHS